MADPYANLEEADGDSAIEFALAANKMCLRALGDPTKSSSSEYSRILSSLESDERIPFVSKMGKDKDGNDVLYNLWKDTKVSIFVWDADQKSFQQDLTPHLLLFLIVRIGKACGEKQQWHPMKPQTQVGRQFWM